MQDRFRFRAWDKTSKEMTNDVQSTYDYGCGGSEGRGLIFEQNFQSALDCEDYIIMQCTGLSDNKGVLIFEGDILKETFNYDGAICYDYTIVKYDESCASFVMFRPDKPTDITFFDDIDLDKENFLVIGNIYQNPDFFRNYYTSKDCEDKNVN